MLGFVEGSQCAVCFRTLSFWLQMIFMYEKKMNFILNVGNTHYFCKKLNKRNKVETIYARFFQNNLTNEMFKSHFKAKLHIPLI